MLRIFRGLARDVSGVKSETLFGPESSLVGESQRPLIVSLRRSYPPDRAGREKAAVDAYRHMAAAFFRLTRAAAENERTRGGADLNV